MRRPLAPLALVVAALAAPAVRAQEAPLTLAAAQSEARARAPEVAALAATLRGAEAVARDARRTFRQDPTLALSAQPGALTGEPREFGYSVGVSLPIDVSGAWGPRGEAADAEVARVGFERDDGLRALDEAVAVTVADLAYAQRGVVRADRIAALEGVIAAAAERELSVGQGDQLAVDAAALDLARARIAAAQARGELAQAQVRLARLLGRAAAHGLVVGDPTDVPRAPDEQAIAAWVERDPRVGAADAELRGAQAQRRWLERQRVPTPTLSATYSYQQYEAPAGAFAGPAANGLSAVWGLPEITLGLSVPLSLFDRQTAPRAQSLARILGAEARAYAVRLDVRSGILASAEGLRAALEGLAAAAPVPALVEREFALLDRAARAGTLDAVARSVAVRRLQEALQGADAAVRDARVARARWVRRSALGSD
jgi:cobalt-zinc-cadmium efflux system outer membrane protein